MLISVIICTYRRYRLLRLAVESLAAQTAGRDQFEVLIIENDETESAEIKKIVLDFSSFLDIRSVTEKVIGLSNARNRGIKEAKGEYLWFLDDDAKANPHYIENLTEIIKKIEPDACGGPYYPYYLTPRPKWFKDEYGTYIYPSLPRFAYGDEFLNGGNMVFNKNIFDKHGLFDKKLGMKGCSFAFGEETEFQMRLRNNGNFKCYLSNDLYILHLVSDVKMKINQQMKRDYSMIRSQYFLWNKDNGKLNIGIFAIVKLFLRLAFSPVNILFRNRNNYRNIQNIIYEKYIRDFNLLRFYLFNRT